MANCEPHVHHAISSSSFVTAPSDKEVLEIVPESPFEEALLQYDQDHVMNQLHVTIVPLIEKHLWTALSNALTTHHTEVLGLRGNNIGTLSPIELESFLSLPGFRNVSTLVISHNGLKDEHFRVLCKLIDEGALEVRKLDVSHNAITEKFVDCLHGIQNKATLQDAELSIDLSSNSIRLVAGGGVKNLSARLKTFLLNNPWLKELNLCKSSAALTFIPQAFHTHVAAYVRQIDDREPQETKSNLSVNLCVLGDSKHGKSTFVTKVLLKDQPPLSSDLRAWTKTDLQRWAKQCCIPPGLLDEFVAKLENHMTLLLDQDKKRTSEQEREKDVEPLFAGDVLEERQRFLAALEELQKEEAKDPEKLTDAHVTALLEKWDAVVGDPALAENVKTWHKWDEPQVAAWVQDCIKSEKVAQAVAMKLTAVARRAGVLLSHRPWVKAAIEDCDSPQGLCSFLTSCIKQLWEDEGLLQSLPSPTGATEEEEKQNEKDNEKGSQKQAKELDAFARRAQVWEWWHLLLYLKVMNLRKDGKSIQHVPDGVRAAKPTGPAFIANKRFSIVLMHRLKQQLNQQRVPGMYASTKGVHVTTANDKADRKHMRIVDVNILDFAGQRGLYAGHEHILPRAASVALIVVRLRGTQRHGSGEVYDEKGVCTKLRFWVDLLSERMMESGARIPLFVVLTHLDWVLDSSVNRTMAMDMIRDGVSPVLAELGVVADGALELWSSRGSRVKSPDDIGDALIFAEYPENARASDEKRITEEYGNIVGAIETAVKAEREAFALPNRLSKTVALVERFGQRMVRAAPAVKAPDWLMGFLAPEVLNKPDAVASVPWNTRQNYSTFKNEEREKLDSMIQSIFFNLSDDEKLVMRCVLRLLSDIGIISCTDRALRYPSPDQMVILSRFRLLSNLLGILADRKFRKSYNDAVGVLEEKAPAPSTCEPESMNLVQLPSASTSDEEKQQWELLKAPGFLSVKVLEDVFDCFRSERETLENMLNHLTQAHLAVEYKNNMNGMKYLEQRCYWVLFQLPRQDPSFTMEDWYKDLDVPENTYHLRCTFCRLPNGVVNQSQRPLPISLPPSLVPAFHCAVLRMFDKSVLGAQATDSGTGKRSYKLVENPDLSADSITCYFEDDSGGSYSLRTLAHKVEESGKTQGYNALDVAVHYSTSSDAGHRGPAKRALYCIYARLLPILRRYHRLYSRHQKVTCKRESDTFHCTTDDESQLLVAEPFLRNSGHGLIVRQIHWQPEPSPPASSSSTPQPQQPTAEEKKA